MRVCLCALDYVRTCLRECVFKWCVSKIILSAPARISESLNRGSGSSRGSVMSVTGAWNTGLNLDDGRQCIKRGNLFIFTLSISHPVCQSVS